MNVAQPLLLSPKPGAISLRVTSQKSFNKMLALHITIFYQVQYYIQQEPYFKFCYIISMQTTPSIINNSSEDNKIKLSFNYSKPSVDKAVVLDFAPNDQIGFQILQRLILVRPTVLPMRLN